MTFLLLEVVLKKENDSFRVHVMPREQGAFVLLTANELCEREDSGNDRRQTTEINIKSQISPQTMQPVETNDIDENAGPK